MGTGDDERAAFERCVRYVRERATSEAHGIYGPGSVTWEIMREPCVVLAAPSAVLLQLAHPAIADGVARYSTFARDYAGRARRTLSTMYDLVFGSLEVALARSHELFAMHARVRGTIDEPGAPSHGRPYRANDQELLRWVAVTLPVCVNQVFERTVRRLGSGDRARLYEEQKVGAAAVGVLPETMPRTVADFERWYAEASSAQNLHVGAKARALLGALERGTADGGPARVVLRALSSAFLPSHVRDGYGLSFGRRERIVLATIFAALRRGNDVVPRGLRSVLAFHQGTRRVARSRHAGGPLVSRIGDALARATAAPTTLSRA